ncbi:C40 family peptidase [Chitinilyticum litopenaei]|uniref:C40 family peptidase n=1 Tax=Chitinilyticum litopenaei TaxID=1121276 RepID=UPI0009DBC77E|nr:C40 family peptidase [Chitinilyticum litopenaei]
MKWNLHFLLAGLLAFAGSALAPFALADETTGTAGNAGSSGWFNEPATASTPTPAATQAHDIPTAKARRSSPKTGGSNPDYAPAQDLLLSAMSLIGVKYKWGGNTPETGLDCSGFVRYVFTSSMNITLPRTAFEMAQRGQSIEKDELRPGDLVFFNTLGRTFSHVGIYLGDNRFIHSPRAGRSVEIVNMNQRYWQQRWNGARRIADAGGEQVNIASLMAGGAPSRQKAAGSQESSSKPERQCRKVTTGKGKKKKTTTVCSTASKPAKSTAGKPKASKSSSKKKSSKPKGKPAAKTSSGKSR